jgi:Holliday junction DNA helicase RuvA
MISTLSGRIQSKSNDSIILNVGGVGFRVRVPTNLLENIGGVGSEVQIFTHLHVREDDLSLYGFASEDGLRLFETLMTVNGIGPKVALGVMSSTSVDRLRNAIGQGNLEILTQIPGIGKKTAQRLVLELKGKLDITDIAEPSEFSAVDDDVVNALINLGYSAAEAAKAAHSVPTTAKTIEDRVRTALQYLGGG